MPDDAFQAGDLAYVTGFGTYRLVRAAGMPPATVPAYSGNGYWEPFSGAPSGPAGGDLSGTYPDPTVSGLQTYPIDPTPPTNGQYLRWDGVAWVPSTLATAGGSSGQTYFFNQATAAQAPIVGLPGTTKQLGTVADVGLTTLTVGPLPPADVFVPAAYFVTDVNVPGIPLIPTGIWVFNIWANSTVLVSGDTKFKVQIYSYDDPAAPVLLLESQPVALYFPDGVEQYTANVVFPQLVALATTRIYVVLQAASTAGGGNIIFSFGDGTPSFVQTSIPAISGTGLIKIVNGIAQPAASLLVPADVNPANLDGLPAVESLRTLGAGPQQACAGDDPRLSDSRTPTGPAGGSLAGTYPNPTLSAVGVAGTYGSASSVPVLTTTSEGRVSAVVPTPIQIAEAQVTGLVGDLAAKADKVTTFSAGAGLAGGGDLSANRTFSMPNVGTPGTYGSGTTVPVFTTDAQGRVTNVTNTPISTFGFTPQYGSFSDSTTQPIVQIGTANVTYFKYNTTELNSGITVTNDLAGNPTRITVSQTGIYEIAYSIQIQKSGGTPALVTIWAYQNRENGSPSPVIRSGSTVDVGGNITTQLPYVALFFSMNAGDYVEFAACSSQSNTNAIALGAQVNPTRPAAPSVIVVAKRIA